MPKQIARNRAPAMFRTRHPPIRHSRFGGTRRLAPPAIAIFRTRNHSQNHATIPLFSEGRLLLVAEATQHGMAIALIGFAFDPLGRAAVNHAYDAGAAIFPCHQDS